MKKEYKIEIISSFLFISLLFSGAIIYHESLPDKTNDTQYIADKEQYDKIVNTVESWKINRTGFTERFILQHQKNGKFYATWVETKYKTADSTLYEIKGAFDMRKNNAFKIQWRYYIKTKNDRIISIIKG